MKNSEVTMANQNKNLTKYKKRSMKWSLLSKNRKKRRELANKSMQLKDRIAQSSKLKAEAQQSGKDMNKLLANYGKKIGRNIAKK